MCKHEEKKCPRCNTAFECKVGDILKCQCYGIELSIAEEAFVKSKYSDCLCSNCLLQLKSRYQLFIEQKIFYVNR
ncbi:cysteine-rich CWC family protein [Ferruginibacter sp.]